MTSAIVLQGWELHTGSSLTEIKAALRRWVVSGPKMAHLIGELVCTLNWQEKGDRHPTPRTNETCTDGICTRCQSTSQYHRRHRQSFLWAQQQPSSTGQQGPCRCRSHRHSDEPDWETRTGPVWTLCQWAPRPPDKDHHRFHQETQLASLQLASSPREDQIPATVL